MEVCDRETCYEGGREATGAVAEANGFQKAADCYVKEISAAARERCWKFSRRGESKGGDRDADD